MIAFVCAMPIELRPLRRRLGLRSDGPLGYTGPIGEHEVAAVVTGMGTALARAATGSVDAAILRLSRQNGSSNFPAVARYLLRHPESLPRLLRLGRGSRRATERAVDAAIRAVS